MPALEINIVAPRSHLVFDGATPWIDPAVQTLPVGEVIRDLRHGVDRGAGAVLLTVDAIGGTWLAALALFGALRDVSDAGRPIVAYVSGYAASVASWYVLGADYLVIDPAAAIIVHGTIDARDGAALDLPADEREQILAVYEHRTATPRAVLEAWCALQPNASGAPEYAVLDAPTCLALGWADAIGSREDASRLAAALATGERPATARRDALRSRPVPAALAQLEERAQFAYLLALGRALGLIHN